jgi:hypothetical protein
LFVILASPILSGTGLWEHMYMYRQAKLWLNHARRIYIGLN